MRDSEKILTYSWKEFLKTPFTLLFFVLLIALGYFIYTERSHFMVDREDYKNKLEECNEARLRDKEVYMNLLHNIKINNNLKKDSIK